MPENKAPPPGRGVRRIPQQTVLYERIVPLALIVMTVLMVIIVLIAAAILFGFVRL